MMYGIDVAALFLTAAFKFFFAMPSALMMGYSFWETVAITSAGGITSTICFYVLSTQVMERTRRRRLKKVAKRLAQGKPTAVRQFTFINKLMVRVKRKVGVLGIAFITPTILSIPIGAVVSAKFYKHQRLMLPALIVSVVCWSVLITTVSYFIAA